MFIILYDLRLHKDIILYINYAIISFNLPYRVHIKQKSYPFSRVSDSTKSVYSIDSDIFLDLEQFSQCIFSEILKIYKKGRDKIKQETSTKIIIPRGTSLLIRISFVNRLRWTESTGILQSFHFEDTERNDISSMSIR